MLSRLGYALGAVVLAVAGYFTVPVHLSHRPEFPPEAPVALIPDELNKGERCRAETIYASRALAGSLTGEGFDFITDDNCAGLQKQLIEAVRGQKSDRIVALLARGANALGKDYQNGGSVCPMQAVSYDNPAIVRLLLDNSADPNRENCCCAMCDSPLVRAVEKGGVESVRLLIERGAKVDYQKHRGDDFYTIFDVRPEKNADEIRALLAAGCDRTLDCRVRYRYGLLDSLVDEIGEKFVF